VNKRFSAIAAAAALACFALSLGLNAIGDKFISACKFGEAGESACHFGALLSTVGASFLAPLRWVVPANAPAWLLFALILAGSLAWDTSHDVLGVGRVANFTAQDAELRVQFNAVSQSIKFTYYQRPDERSPWVRQCSALEWREVLVRVLHKRLRWFASAAAA